MIRSFNLLQTSVTEICDIFNYYKDMEILSCNALNNDYSGTYVSAAPSALITGSHHKGVPLKHSCATVLFYQPGPSRFVSIWLTMAATFLALLVLEVRWPYVVKECMCGEDTLRSLKVKKYSLL